MTSEQRHKNMAAIRSKDTKPELIVRCGLWNRGFRYRLNSPRLPGHPDLVLRKYRTCVFVNGCFWHGHHVKFTEDNAPSSKCNAQRASHDASGCTEESLSEVMFESSACCKVPKTNQKFWVAKIRRNQERDVEEQRRLAEMGWHCITVWECELKPAVREQTLRSLAYTLNKIWLNDHSVKKPYPVLEEESGCLMAAEESVRDESDGGV